MKLFSNLDKRHYLLLAGWVLINVLQAVFTNLHADEAYYWMYSLNPDWGFFDHPPMTALLVFLGDSLMHNEFGVRLLVLVLSTVTMAMIMNELNEQKDLLFLAVFILSFPLVHTHIAGFLAIPDSPLVFFTLLFYLLYKRFVEKPTLQLSVLMAFVAAAMIYSKYHAFLALGFVVLSNLKLLKNKYFWLTIGITLILLLPHVLWQVANEYPSLKYHLYSRSKPIRFWTVHNNLTSQLLVAGPITGLIVFYSLFKYRTNGDLFRRMMIFSILGFYIFFFIMSFKNRIEAHYTTVITPLLMFATYPFIASTPNLKKWFKRIAIPVVVLLLAVRFYLAVDFIPNVGQIKISFYNHPEWTSEVKQLAAGKPVGSFNNFDIPGTYQFYTGDPAVHLAMPGYRFCQYDMWDEEKAVEGDSVFVIIPDRMDNSNLVQLSNGKKYKLLVIPEFQSLKHLTVAYNDVHVTTDSVKMKITLTNNAEHAIQFLHPSSPQIGITHAKKAELITTPLAEITGMNQLEQGQKVSFKYSFALSLIERKEPVLIFTQTIDRNRGEMAALKLSDYISE
ncbi:MAG TPA: hypothetical protein DER09_08660 [Prolixibacteraceae bacterium]|nr:hypothetical protein [Prolixibacteraceae bacterium]